MTETLNPSLLWESLTDSERTAAMIVPLIPPDVGQTKAWALSLLEPHFTDVALAQEALDHLVEKSILRYDEAKSTYYVADEGFKKFVFAKVA